MSRSAVTIDYTGLLVAIVAADWLTFLTPGPNFLLVTQEAMLRSRANGVAAGLGIATGSLIWCLVVILGLDEAFRLLPWLSPTLRAIGAMYLAYLGITLWLHSDQPQMRPAGQQTTASRLSRTYAKGILISITNPTAIAFYAGLFSDLMRPNDPRWVLASAVSLMVLGSVAWNLFLSFCFSTGAVQRFYARVWKPLTRIAAVAMLGFGLQIAVSLA